MLVENVRALCKARGISIHKLEEAVGLGSGTIYKWKGGSPNVTTLQLVADYLGVSLDELVGRK